MSRSQAQSKILYLGQPELRLQLVSVMLLRPKIVLTADDMVRNVSPRGKVAVTVLG